MVFSKKLIATGAMAALLCTALLTTGCAGQPSSSSDSSSSAATEELPEKMTVHLSLQEDVTSPEAADTPLQFADEEIDIEAPYAATVLDVLEASGREIKTNGSGNDLEVIAIGGLENGDAGEGSHWEYSVNDNPIKSSPSTYALNEGNTVVWTFVKGTDQQS